MILFFCLHNPEQLSAFLKNSLDISHHRGYMFHIFAYIEDAELTNKCTISSSPGHGEGSDDNCIVTQCSLWPWEKKGILGPEMDIAYMSCLAKGRATTSLPRLFGNVVYSRIGLAGQKLHIRKHSGVITLSPPCSLLLLMQMSVFCSSPHPALHHPVKTLSIRVMARGRMTQHCGTLSTK